MKISIRNIVIPMLLLCFITSTTYAQQLLKDNEILSGSMLNGRFWKSISESEKVIYIVGFNEAIGIASVVGGHAGKDKTVVNEEINSFFKSNLLSGEIRDEVNLFYEEGANAPLPIFNALKYVSLKANGASKKELDDYVVERRKIEANRPDEN